MIKHHPEKALLLSFVRGELAASLSAAIAIHADMCPCCQAQITQLLDEQASQSFAQDGSAVEPIAQLTGSLTKEAINFDDMIGAIVADDEVASLPVRHRQNITLNGADYTLPQALDNIELGNITHLGKLSRVRLKLAEGAIHSSLLHIQADGGVPEHTHKGYELTLLLDGEFSDEHGHYVPGDFMLLDGKNTHKPYSENGCLCFTVVSDALHFTQGVNRLLNPIGSLIY